MVVHPFNPSTWDAGRSRQISQFYASLVYSLSSRTARATLRNHVSRNKTKNKQTNKKKPQRFVFEDKGQDFIHSYIPRNV